MTRSVPRLLLAALFLLYPLAARPADPGPGLRQLYEQLRGAAYAPKAVRVDNFVLQKDRIAITLTGLVYLEEPVEGRPRGAVFSGTGSLRVEPWSSFERDNIKRYLKSESIEASFGLATMRFSDDTAAQFTGLPEVETDEATRERLRSMRADFQQRLLRETGANLSDRIAGSIANGETPGMFFAEFDSKDRGRFCAVFDPQARILSDIFELNGGEAGLLFQYKSAHEGTDIWTTFFSQADFARGQAVHADQHRLVRVPHVDMRVDVREPDKLLAFETDMTIEAARPGIRIVPLRLNEDLDEWEDQRLKKAMRIKDASLADGTPLDFVQEDWQIGFSVGLPRPLAAGEKAVVRLKLEARDFMPDWRHFHFPLSTSRWFPRYGYLDRTSFDLAFRHPSKWRVVSVGELVAEGPSKDDPNEWMTHWICQDPVALITFAVGPFEPHEEKGKVGGHELPIRFYSARGDVLPIKEDFVLTELMNATHYFSYRFGDYPYSRLKGVFFPARFGQGFPTLLLLPVTGRARLGEFAFISHEVAHQWWGDMVTWRSYRDQWLSEGFAQYSAALYSSERRTPKEAMDLVKNMREELLLPPVDEVGLAKGKLYEIGPLVMGHRLATRKTRGAYTAMIYSKGALVMRMLHMLFSESPGGDDDAFWAMMKDFVERHRDRPASTESFFQVAAEHFARTPLAREYGLQDLNWFRQEWVYETDLPKYRMEYRIEPRAEGGVFLTGALYQEGVPEHWFMPVPVLVDFGGKRYGSFTLPAYGPRREFKVALPERPKKVELDPYSWVLSLKTETKG